MICSPVFIKHTSLMGVIYSSNSSHLLRKKTRFRRKQIEFDSHCFVYYLFVLFGSVCPIPSHHTRYFFLSLLWKSFLLNVFLLECSLYISVGRRKIVSKNHFSRALNFFLYILFYTDLSYLIAGGCLLARFSRKCILSIAFQRQVALMTNTLECSPYNTEKGYVRNARKRVCQM